MGLPSKKLKQLQSVTDTIFADVQKFYGDETEPLDQIAIDWGFPPRALLGLGMKEVSKIIACAHLLTN